MAEGGSFGQSFAQARKAGLDVFEWKGKKYTTQVAGESKKQTVVPMKTPTRPVAKAPVAAKPVPSKPTAGKTPAVVASDMKMVDNRNFFKKLFNMDEDSPERFSIPADVYEAYEQQSSSNSGKKFGIVSKKNARAYFFDEDGNLSIQDEVGLGKEKGEKQPVFYKVQTTPSGTYHMKRGNFKGKVADQVKNGFAADNFFFLDHTDPNKKLLDNPDMPHRKGARQAMHGLPRGLEKERSKAFGNKSVDDNYMSAGCINCRKPFLDNPYFNNFQEGNVYVLPEKEKGGSTFSGNAWYDVGGKVTKKQKDDSTLENIIEVFDPTGITSWDDVYRSYQETGFSPETALEVMGALPLLGKLGKLSKAGIHLKKYKGLDSKLYKHLPKSNSLSNTFETVGRAGRGTDMIQAAHQAPNTSFLPFEYGGDIAYAAFGQQLDKFNEGLTKGVDNMVANTFGNPWSLYNMAGFAGNVVDGINNRKQLREAESRERLNYSTMEMNLIADPGQGSRGFRPVSGTMQNRDMPDRIGGLNSFYGMDQKYFIPTFAGGGMMIPDLFTPGEMLAESVPSLPSFEMPTSKNLREMMPSVNTEEAPSTTLEGNTDLRDFIGQKESGNRYDALPKDKNGKVVSSAAGKYQFLWNSHKNKIQELTGVTSKQEFLNNPDAQEKYFDYWDQTVLTPEAKKLQEEGVNVPEPQLKYMIHFAGPKGARDYFLKGKETVDAFGMNTSRLLKRMKPPTMTEFGGETEMSAEEIAAFMAMGGEIEYLD